MLRESPGVQLDLVIDEVDTGSVESLTGEDGSGGGDIGTQDCLSGTQPKRLSSVIVNVDSSLGHAPREGLGHLGGEAATNTSLQDTESHAVKRLWGMGGVGGRRAKILWSRRCWNARGGASGWVTVKQEGPKHSSPFTIKKTNTTPHFQIKKINTPPPLK